MCIKETIKRLFFILIAKKPFVKKKRLSENISPSYLFGKWKNLDIDAKKIRHEAWDRSQLIQIL